MTLLDSRFAGTTVVADWRDEPERADILYHFVRRHTDAGTLKKYEHAHLLDRRFEKLEENEYERLLDIIDLAIDDISEIAPAGTYFGYHPDGGCIGFWHTKGRD
jgi:hypothetical protein